MLDWLLPAAVEHGSTLQKSEAVEHGSTLQKSEAVEHGSTLQDGGYRRRRMNSRSRVLPTMKSYSPAFSQP